MKAKQRKVKKSELTKLQAVGWNTTDADEITRRRLRGETEKFKIENIEADYPYFGTYRLYSKGTQYLIEIRSLDELINSCECLDYRGNGLGTCKHIEHILFRLKKKGAKLFRQASLAGSSRIEIYLDRRHSPVLRIWWPKKLKTTQAKALLESFFSSDGSLLADPVLAYSTLQHTITENSKSIKKQIRLSCHMDDFIDYRRQTRLEKLF